jgi:hypothetical protein
VITVGSGLTQAGAQGLNSLRFLGRIGGRSLGAGSYRLIAAVSGGGSTQPAADFRVLG